MAVKIECNSRYVASSSHCLSYGEQQKVMSFLSKFIFKSYLLSPLIFELIPHLCLLVRIPLDLLWYHLPYFTGKNQKG